MKRLSDYADRDVRLTDERLEHIEQRPEMEGQTDRVEETLKEPGDVRKSEQDEAVFLYYRQYDETPVTEKYLLVVVKVGTESPFVITAFYTDRIKSGRVADAE